MSWRTLIALSAAVGLTVTSLELLLKGHSQGIFMGSSAAMLRVVATAATAVILLSLTAGLVARGLSRRVGITPGQAMTAGVLAVAVPAGLYMGGIEVEWDHNAFGMWFVVGVPVVFGIAVLMIRGAPMRLLTIAETGWPTVAPVVGWTLLIYVLYLTGVLPIGSAIVMAAIWLAGLVIVAVVVLRHPSVGHWFTCGTIALCLVGVFGTSVKPNLNRTNSLVTPASRDATPVILLTVDTLRRDALSMYGSQTPTPALDRLAADSVVFDRAYSTGPWTYVSFSSIHSGLTPWGHGIHTRKDRLDPQTTALSSLMRDHGYHSTAIGSNGVLTGSGVGGDLARSFDDHIFYPRVLLPNMRAYQALTKIDPEVLSLSISTRQLSRYGSEWVRNHQASAPFLLWIHFLDPHGPYDDIASFPPSSEPTPEVQAIRGVGRTMVPREPRVRGLSEWSRALYQSEVQMMDQEVGKFLQTLRDEGIYDRALIVFASDHGEEFTEHNGFAHGRTVYEELVRVPLAVKLPQSSKTGRISRPVSTVAILPTILDMLSIPYETDDYSAESLRNSWQHRSDEDTSPSEPVFMTGNHRDEPAEAVVWDDNKLIRWLNQDHEELYDLASDPGELYNLAAQRPEQVQIGRALLSNHANAEAKRASRRGFTSPDQSPLSNQERELLRGLGYIQ